MHRRWRVSETGTTDVPGMFPAARSEDDSKLTPWPSRPHECGPPCRARRTGRRCCARAAGDGVRRHFRRRTWPWPRCRRGADLSRGHRCPARQRDRVSLRARKLRDARGRRLRARRVFPNSFKSALTLRLARIPARWGYGRPAAGFCSPNAAGERLRRASPRRLLPAPRARSGHAVRERAAAPALSARRGRAGAAARQVGIAPGRRSSLPQARRTAKQAVATRTRGGAGGGLVRERDATCVLGATTGDRARDETWVRATRRRRRRASSFPSGADESAGPGGRDAAVSPGGVRTTRARCLASRSGGRSWRCSGRPTGAPPGPQACRARHRPRSTGHVCCVTVDRSPLHETHFARLSVLRRGQAAGVRGIE